MCACVSEGRGEALLNNLCLGTRGGAGLRTGAGMERDERWEMVIGWGRVGVMGFGGGLLEWGVLCDGMGMGKGGLFMGWKVRAVG